MALKFDEKILASLVRKLLSYNNVGKMLCNIPINIAIDTIMTKDTRWYIVDITTNKDGNE